MLIARYGASLPELRAEQFEAHRQESEEPRSFSAVRGRLRAIFSLFAPHECGGIQAIIERSQRKAALLAGMDEADFDELYRRFLDTEKRDEYAVVDRGGLNMADFAALMRDIGLDHVAERPQFLFGLLDSDGNGHVSVKELVDAFVALSSKSNKAQRLKWAFDKFDRNQNGSLGLPEVRDLIQFLCIMQSMQHTLSPEPTVWETQRWFPAAGWKPHTGALSSHSFADEFGEAVAEPTKARRLCSCVWFCMRWLWFIIAAVISGALFHPCRSLDGSYGCIASTQTRKDGSTPRCYRLMTKCIAMIIAVSRV